MTETGEALAARALGGLLPEDWAVAPAPDDAPPEGRLWIIPGHGGPRWIVPEDPDLGWPGLAAWRPFGRVSRAKWAAVMATYRARRLGRLPGVAAIGIVPAADGTGWETIGWDEARPPALVVSIGAPGPTRKATAILVSRARRAVVAVAKAPLAPGAAARIRHEAETLDRLARARPGLAPRLLHHDADRGRSLQAALPGSAMGGRLAAPHRAFLAALAPPVATLPRAEFLADLAARLAAVETLAPETAARRRAALAALAGPGAVGIGRVHGDFAPWNLRRARDGALAAFDWEFAEPAGLRGHDAAHFIARVAIAGGARAPGVLERRVVAALSRPALRPLLGHGDARLVWRLYVLAHLATLAECGIADGHAEIFNQVVETWRHEPL